MEGGSAAVENVHPAFFAGASISEDDGFARFLLIGNDITGFIPSDDPLVTPWYFPNPLFRISPAAFCCSPDQRL